MKLDEYNLLLGKPTDIPPKRLAYILKKWVRKGWFERGLLTNKFTDEFYRVRKLTQEMAANFHRYMEKYDGRVVTIIFKKWNIPQTIGILEDHGDNGWHLFTRKSCRHESEANWTSSLYIFQPEEEIAYIEFHPNPKNIWRRMNYLSWKYCHIEDRFHKKISTMSYGTVCDYSQAHLGIFIHTNPAGKIGECFPYCQCKHL